MYYVMQVTTFVRSSEGDGRISSYKRSFNVWNYARAKQMEAELTCGSETDSNRITWQEANICVTTSFGRTGERLIIPLSEVPDIINDLQMAWDASMSEKIGPRRT